MAKIEITTSQNVTIDFDSASVMERAFVFFIDFCCVWLGIFILFLISLIFLDVGFGEYFENFGIILFLIGNLCLEIVTGGRTIGRMMFKFKIMKTNGEQASVYDLILRWAFRIVDLYASIGTVGALSIVSSERNQRLGDFLADTVVIRINKIDRMSLLGILKLDEKTQYVPTYPTIKHFDEGDIVLIKETTDRYLKHPTSGSTEAVDLLTKSMAEKLDLGKPPGDNVKFLRTLVNDYAFLTR